MLIQFQAIYFDFQVFLYLMSPYMWLCILQQSFYMTICNLYPIELRSWFIVTVTIVTTVYYMKHYVKMD